MLPPPTACAYHNVGVSWLHVDIEDYEELVHPERDNFNLAVCVDCGKDSGDVAYFWFALYIGIVPCMQLPSWLAAYMRVRLASPVSSAVLNRESTASVTSPPYVLLAGTR